MKFVVENKDGTLTYPVGRARIASMFTNVSFPASMVGYVNKELGIYPYSTTTPPESEFTHVNRITEPIKVGDEYLQQWETPIERPQEDIDNFFSSKFGRVKAYAQSIIKTKYPDWKQRNLLHRTQVLLSKDSLTTEELQEQADIAAAWDWIDSVRDASNSLESYLTGIGIAAAMDYDIISYEGWPE